jgi:hypothetical protein
MKVVQSAVLVTEEETPVTIESPHTSNEEIESEPIPSEQENEEAPALDNSNPVPEESE